MQTNCFFFLVVLESQEYSYVLRCLRKEVITRQRRSIMVGYGILWSWLRHGSRQVNQGPELEGGVDSLYISRNIERT